jgi:iron complex outermembrane receptor protein
MTNYHAYAGYNLNDNWIMRAGFTLADYSFQDPGSDQNPLSTSFLGDITRRMTTFSLKNNYTRTMGGVYAFYNSGDHSFSDGWVSDDVNKGINIYQALKFWKGGTLTAGFDFKNYGGKGSFGFLADSFLTVNETAGYLMADQELFKIFKLSAGARYENHTNFGDEIVPQFGITLQPIQNTVIKALASKGFRSPTIMEMYLFAPNSDLGPERLWNYELSVSQRLGAIGIVNGSLYKINGSNLIIMQPNPGAGPPMIRSNGGSFENWGIELESTIEPIDHLRIDLNYSYLNTDQRLYFAPRHQFYAGAMYTIGGLKLAANLKSVSGLYTNINTESPELDMIESYLIADAKIAYRIIENLEIHISGKNLLNQKYQTVFGYPMPGINLMAGISFQVN